MRTVSEPFTLKTRSSADQRGSRWIKIALIWTLTLVLGVVMCVVSWIVFAPEYARAWTLVISLITLFNGFAGFFITRIHKIWEGEIVLSEDSVHLKVTVDGESLDEEFRWAEMTDVRIGRHGVGHGTYLHFRRAGGWLSIGDHRFDDDELTQTIRFIGTLQAWKDLDRSILSISGPGLEDDLGAFHG